MFIETSIEASKCCCVTCHKEWYRVAGASDDCPVCSAPEGQSVCMAPYCRNPSNGRDFCRECYESGWRVCHTCGQLFNVAKKVHCQCWGNAGSGVNIRDNARGANTGAADTLPGREVAEAEPPKAPPPQKPCSPPTASPPPTPSVIKEEEDKPDWAGEKEEESSGWASQPATIQDFLELESFVDLRDFATPEEEQWKRIPKRGEKTKKADNRKRKDRLSPYNRTRQKVSV